MIEKVMAVAEKPYTKKEFIVKMKEEQNWQNERKITIKKKHTSLLFTIILIFVVQQAASKLSTWIALQFNYSKIDIDNTFMFISVHHIVQLLVALAIIWVLTKKYSFDFFFNMGNRRKGLKYVCIFTAIIFLYVLISYIAGYSLGSIVDYPYPLNTKNVLGTLGFQLLLSGTSEEILFRALPIAILANYCIPDKKVFLWKSDALFAVMIAAILFSAAHINWSFFPFFIGADAFQLIYAFLLGLIYGITYQSTKSIVYPIIMHGISNVLMVGVGYIFQTIL